MVLFIDRPFFRPQTTPNGEWQRAYLTFSAARRCNRRNRRSISPFAPAGQKILALLRSPYHDFLPLFAPPLGTHGRPARGYCAGKPSCALAARSAAAVAGGGGGAGPAGCLRLRDAAGGGGAAGRRCGESSHQLARRETTHRAAVPLAPAHASGLRRAVLVMQAASRRSK